MLVVVPLKSGDEGRDNDVSAQTRSKSKSEKSSKKRKSSKSKKTKGHSSSEPSPKKAKGVVIGDKVSPFFFFEKIMFHSYDNMILTSHVLTTWHFT